MSLKNLKKQMKENNKKKLVEDSNSGSNRDERFYIPSQDAEGKINVKVRLLPSYIKDEDGDPISLESYAKVKYHNISNCGKEKRWMGKTLCRRSIGKECPICDHGWDIYNEMKDEDKEKALKLGRKWWSQEKIITNIQVLEDKENPENEGKIFLFEMGIQIYNNIKAQMTCEENKTIDDRDFYKVDKEAVQFDAWDLDESFVLQLSRTAGEKSADGKSWKDFPVWSKTRLLTEDAPEEVENQEELVEKAYSLVEFKDEAHYPTLEETESKLKFLTYQEDEDDSKEKNLAESDEEEEEEEKPKSKVKKESKKKEEPKEEVEDDSLTDLSSFMDELDNM